jgi:uncharacterized protein (TIGR02246 family)
MMRSVIIATCALLAASALMPACAPRPFAAVPAARDALEAREATFLAALAARDADAVAAHFADDGMLHIANMPPVRGRAAIRQFHVNVFRFMTSSAAVPETLRVSAVGDLGYSAGRVANVFAGEQGPMEYAGKYLIAWEQRGGQWLAAVYSISSNQPEAGALPRSR